MPFLNTVNVLTFFLSQLRFQKCVDAHPEIIQKVAVTEQEKLKEKVEKDKAEKDKVSWMLEWSWMLFFNELMFFLFFFIFFLRK